MRFTGIDHVLIGVSDLEAAADIYRRLGFQTTPRGRHIGQGTAEHCLMLSDAYVKLVGVADPREPAHALGCYLAEGEGLRGLALDVDVAGLQQGTAPTTSVDFGCQLELPEATVLQRCRPDTIV